MARKATPVGRFARGLIEDAPIDLILGVFKARGPETDNEPDFGLAEVLEILQELLLAIQIYGLIFLQIIIKKLLRL